MSHWGTVCSVSGLRLLLVRLAAESKLHFGDIWCLFVSFGPAPHIYQRGERVGEPVCNIHGHYPGYLVVGPAGQHGTEDGPHAPTLEAVQGLPPGAFLRDNVLLGYPRGSAGLAGMAPLASP